MKKVFSFLIAVVLIASLFAVSAFAGTDPELTATVVDKKTFYAQGDTFDVILNVSNIASVQGVTLYLDYDTSALSMTAVNGDSFTVMTEGLNLVFDTPKAGATGKLVTITFKVETAAVLGNDYSVSFADSEWADSAFDTHTFSAQSVSVNVNHDHSKFATKVPAKAKTCSVNGNKEYYECTCGKLFTTSACTAETTLADVTIAASHELSHVTAKAATCVKKGNNEYWECTVCKSLFSDAAGTVGTSKTAVEIPVNASNHTGTAIHHAKQDADCFNAGNIEYYECPDCHANFAEQAMITSVADFVIPATNHVGTVEHETAGAATCTAGSHIEYWHCTKCNKYFNNSDLAAAHEIAASSIETGALGHQFSVTWGEFNADYTEITAALECQRPGCGCKKNLVCKVSGGDGTITYGESTATCGADGYIPVTATIPAPTAPDTFLDGSLLFKEGNKPASATGEHHYTVEIIWNTGSETPSASYTCSCLGCSSQPNGNCEVTFEDTVPATCVAGTRVYTATVTDDAILSHLALGTKTYDTMTVTLAPVVNHDLTESETNEDFVYVPEVAATKDKAGMKAHWECKDHGVIYTLSNGTFAPATQAEIDALTIAYVAPVTPSDKKTSPKTGDDANIALWAVILTVSAVSVGAVLNLTKKSEI